MFIFEKAQFASCHASTIVEVEDGKFLAAWFGGKEEGANDVKIWGCAFDGKKWSDPEVFAVETGFPCWNPVLFLSKSKTVMLFYKGGPNPSSWTSYIRRSTDAGKTWSEPQPLLAGLIGPVKNKPIQRGDAILAGTSVEAHKAWCCWVERSLDEGKSWKRFGPLNVPDKPYGLIQPTLLETGDKKTIIALCRSRNIGFICQSESKDGGETWSEAKPTELSNPNSGIDAVRAANNDWYLVYNPTKSARTPLLLARSTDDGKTWKTVATLEDQPGEFSYPAIIQTADGQLQVTYTYNRKHIKHLTFDPAKL
jgi:predicted neuraminidase